MVSAKNVFNSLKSLRQLRINDLSAVRSISTTFSAQSRIDDVIDHSRPLPIPSPAFEHSSRPGPADSSYLSPSYTWKNPADSTFSSLTFPASYFSGPKTASPSFSEAERCSSCRVSHINHQTRPVHTGSSSKEFQFPVHTRPLVQIIRTGFTHIHSPSHTLPCLIVAPTSEVCTIKQIICDQIQRFNYL